LTPAEIFHFRISRAGFARHQLFLRFEFTFQDFKRRLATSSDSFAMGFRDAEFLLPVPYDFAYYRRPLVWSGFRIG